MQRKKKKINLEREKRAKGAKERSLVQQRRQQLWAQREKTPDGNASTSANHGQQKCWNFNGEGKFISKWRRNILKVLTQNIFDPLADPLRCHCLRAIGPPQGSYNYIFAGNRQNPNHMQCEISLIRSENGLLTVSCIEDQLYLTSDSQEI